jgi:hypothetical protein
MKLNLTKFGHFNDQINSDEDYLLNILSRKFDISFSKRIDLKKKNIIFEGHQKINHEKLLNLLEKSTYKTILVITEDLIGEDSINHKFFTMNNEPLSHKRLILKKSIKIQLFFYHFQFYFTKILMFTKLDRIFSFFKSNKKTDIYNQIFYWKERYLLFLDLLPYIEEVWFLRENNLKYYKKVLKIYNIKYKIVYYRVTKIIKKVIKKKYDILITGTLNEYRINIINNLSKYFKIKYDKFLKLKDLKHSLKISKYYLILNKSHYKLFPSSARMKIALENDCMPLIDKTFFTDFLNKYTITLKDINNIRQLNNVIKRYKYHHNNIFSLLKKKYYSKNYFNFI